jgi:NAD(P) transhydrogenase subunit alpha
MAAGETRVALTPDVVSKLTSQGMEVRIESGAGIQASYTDQMYEAAGAKVEPDRVAMLKACDMLLAVQMPDDGTLASLRKGAVLVGFIWAKSHPERVATLEKLGITALAMDAVPRISRAQTMDALSSMSNIAGYKAVLMAAAALDKYLPMMMTAAGTIPPAKALILGAGVAGLQAIATAKRLGAVVEAFDVRPAVKEQVQSLGASFVDVPLEQEDTETKGGYAKELSERNKELQRQVLAEHIRKSDIVVTTALIPGRPAPVLITRDMAESMAPGSVIVDIAAEQGGNCELTKAGETVIHNGVKILGPVNLPATLAFHASRLYARNMQALLALLVKDGKLNLDMGDEIIAESMVAGAPKAASPAAAT